MSATYALLLAATAVVGLAAMAVAYRRSRDPFHPLILACPIAIFLYVVVPLMLSAADMLDFFLPRAGLEQAQAVFLVLLAAFCAGALAASGRARFDERRSRPLRLSDTARRRVLIGGVVLGSAGTAVWLALTLSRGGLRRVYAVAYGGGLLHDWGWVRESVNLSLVGAVLCLAAGAGRRPGWRWALAASFAAPQILHAWFGTRRGPAFVCAVLLLAGPYLMAGRRPRVALTLMGGATLGLVLILLVANRARIYYGSSRSLTFELTRSPVLHADSANEYIVASGLVVTAARTGRYGWGLSYLEQFVLRPIPSALLPGKYSLLPQTGVTAGDMAAALGWPPIRGSATTLFGHLYAEFAWAAIAASALVGALYGRAWRRAVESPGVGWLVLYVLLLQGLLHLWAQDLTAMAVPFMLMFVPSWMALLWTLDRPFRPPAAPATVPAAA